MTDIQEHETIWYPGVYGGRQESPWTDSVETVPTERIIELVHQRAEEDGEWAIANGHVGKNNEHEAKMRRMMAFVSDEKNIRQCIDYIFTENTANVRTVDFVCRDLANASSWAVAAQERKAERD